MSKYSKQNISKPKEQYKNIYHDIVLSQKWKDV